MDNVPHEKLRWEEGSSLDKDTCRTEAGKFRKISANIEFEARKWEIVYKKNGFSLFRGLPGWEIIASEDKEKIINSLISIEMT